MNPSKKRLIAAFIALVLLLAMTTPTQADPRVVNGDRIVLTGNITEYSANAPFWVSHGTCISVAAGVPPMTGLVDFTLEVDGTLIEENFEWKNSFWGQDGYRYVCSTSVFNFPNGLGEGAHTLTGHWFVACKTAEVVCEFPAEPIEWLSVAKTITFMP